MEKRGASVARLLYILALTFALCLPFMLSASAETLEDAAETFKNAESFNEQLSCLSRLADTHAGELESDGWNVSLRVKCAEDLPHDLIPMNFDTYGYTERDGFPEEVRGHKFIALYIARDGKQPELAGEWLARFPRDMRASSLEEAEYALVVEGWWTPSGYKYIPFGSSSHRDYAAYVLNLKNRKAVRFWFHRNGAKHSGTVGSLSGDDMSANELWNALRASFWGVIRLDAGGGVALLFSPTGHNCFLKGYEGEPTEVVIPDQVEGYSVTSMEKKVFHNCDTLRSITLPDTVKAVSASAFQDCDALETVILPAGLEKISGHAFDACPVLENLTLPEGLKSIGDNAFKSCSGLKSLTLPHGLESIGEGAFRYAAGLTEIVIPPGVTSWGEDVFCDCSALSRVVVEDGVERLSSGMFREDYALACIRLPASLNRENGLSSLNFHTVVYAPEGSYALTWALEQGYEAVACESSEKMPAVEYVTEGSLTFRVFRDEAMLAACADTGSGINVPDTVNGVPVTGLIYQSICGLEDAESVSLPVSVRTIHYRAVQSARGKREFHVYVPNPDCVIEKEGIRPYTYEKGYSVTVHGPEGSAVQRYVTDMDQQDCILFEPMGEGVDANIRTLRDALSLAEQVQESATEFWQTCDRTANSLLAAVPGYDIGSPKAAVILRVTKAELKDPSLQMAGNANALKMYTALANTRADMSYARASSQTARSAQLAPVADGTSAIVVLAYPNDWILVSLMQDGNSQAALLTTASGTPAELTAEYVMETAAAFGVEGDCIMYSGEAFAAITGK